MKEHKWYKLSTTVWYIGDADSFMTSTPNLKIASREAEEEDSPQSTGLYYNKPSKISRSKKNLSSNEKKQGTVYYYI